MKMRFPIFLTAMICSLLTGGAFSLYGQQGLRAYTASLEKSGEQAQKIVVNGSPVLQEEYVGNAFSLRLASEGRLPFKDGEKLTYTLGYKWGSINSDVGEGVITTEFSDSTFHAVIDGRTTTLFDLFFKVREHFETVVSLRSMRPLSFYRESHEGRYSMINRYSFHPDCTISARTIRMEAAPKDTLLKGDATTYDLVSLYFTARCIDFTNIQKDSKHPIAFAIDREIYNLYFIYCGREVKKIKGLGTFNTLKFNVRLVAGEVFKADDEMTLWVSDDENKIPLLFESPILKGKVYGRLKEYSSLAHKLSSKIK